MTKTQIFLFFVLNMITPLLYADTVPMDDFIQLRRGMSEAEVLYRLGGYDHESVRTDLYHNVLEKTWYYIPNRKGTGKWISEIVFDSSGRIKSTDRYRARK